MEYYGTIESNGGNPIDGGNVTYSCLIYNPNEELPVSAIGHSIEVAANAGSAGIKTYIEHILKPEGKDLPIIPKPEISNVTFHVDPASLEVKVVQMPTHL